MQRKYWILTRFLQFRIHFFENLALKAISSTVADLGGDLAGGSEVAATLLAIQEPEQPMTKIYFSVEEKFKSILEEISLKIMNYDVILNILKFVCQIFLQPGGRRDIHIAHAGSDGLQKELCKAIEARPGRDGGVNLPGGPCAIE